MEQTTTKRCSACHQMKPRTEFAGNRSRADGLQHCCKACTRVFARRRRQPDWSPRRAVPCAWRGCEALVIGWRSATPACAIHKDRSHALRRKFGLEVADYFALLDLQKGRCAICRDDRPGGNGGWHVDHDRACCPGIHSCGHCVRGLLCHRCNTGLGSFRDSTDRLKNAIRYLDRTQPKLRLVSGDV